MCSTSSPATRRQSAPLLGLPVLQVAVAVLVACACLKACLGGLGVDAAAAAPRDGFVAGATMSPKMAVTPTGMTYCGIKLSNALKFLCNGQYNSYFKSKTPEQFLAQPVQAMQLPFRERLRAAAFLESRTRFTRGVYDECCYKSCTVDELMNYCMGDD